MQNLPQALNNLINVALLLAIPILVIALIIAGLNIASTDGGRHQKAKKQLIGITIAVIIILGAKFILPALVNLVPGASAAVPF